MKSGSYHMIYSGHEFEKHVEDKFKNLIPNEFYVHEDLKKALKDLKIASIIPNTTLKGEHDNRCTVGWKYLVKNGCIPDCVKTPLPTKTLAELSKGFRGAHSRYNLKRGYIKTMIDMYHKHQLEILPLIDIKCNERGWMLVDENGESRECTTEEFVLAIDSESCHVMEMYADQSRLSQEEYEYLGKLLELCRYIVVQRLCLQAYAMRYTNNFMTERGWKRWRDHQLVISSFAVYFVSLHLCGEKGRVKKRKIGRINATHFLNSFKILDIIKIIIITVGLLVIGIFI